MAMRATICGTTAGRLHAGTVTGARSSALRRPLPLRRVAVVVKAQDSKPKSTQESVPESTPQIEPEVSTSEPASTSTAASLSSEFPFSGVQEAINGRAAMLGFAVAVFTELTTGQSVLSQVGGKYVDSELVEKALGFSDMSFAFLVVLISLATFAPLVYTGEKPGSRSFAFFTPELETKVGRVAMMGFAGLVLVEMARGNTAIF